MEKPSNRFTTAEKMICRLRDVSSCDIQVDARGDITAVHVTARAGRSPKQIARDIEAILAAEEGVSIDHRKISIAQFGEADRRGPRARGRSRRWGGWRWPGSACTTGPARWRWRSR